MDALVQTYPDFTAEEWETVGAVGDYTMTSPERIVALTRAVDHIARRGISGDFVECGVWRGGSMMAAAITLLRNGDSARSLYLYDTFEGMSEPTDLDVSVTGQNAAQLIATTQRDERDHLWAYSPLQTVQSNLRATGYPPERMRFVAGPVEETIPMVVPHRIALLRLDTDWYESTKHELEHLYPLLVSGGVLIIDDYGHWKGARQATDEYFATLANPPLLQRIDYTARIAVKP